MKCNCIRENEEQIEKYFKEHEEYSNILSTQLGGKMLMFNKLNEVITTLSLPVTIEYTKENKKSGNLVKKKQTYTMNFTYCPWCGKKINPKED